MQNMRMKKTIARQLVGILGDAGIQRMYGIVGDSLNPVIEGLHEDGRIRWVHMRNEEAAAFAASAEAQITGELAACCGSSGPGNLHLINGLYDAHQSHAPVFALASHIPLCQVGTDYFQETHPTQIFAGCTAYCELISLPSQAPRIVQQAIMAAKGEHGVGMCVLSGDVAGMRAENEWMENPRLSATPSKTVPDRGELEKLAALIAENDDIVLFCGIGCREAKEEVLALARLLNAPIAYTFRSKDFLESQNDYAIGMTGLLGWGAAYEAMQHCKLLILLGTDFPYSDFFPKTGNVQLVQIDREAKHIGRRCHIDLGICGDVGASIQGLLPLLKEKEDDSFLKHTLAHHKKTLRSINAYIKKGKGHHMIRPEYITSLLNQYAASNAIFTVDTGTPDIWAARYLCGTGQRRIIGSFKHGSMACAMPMAIGAQFAAPKQQVIALCGDGGLAMGLGDILTIVQYKLPIKLVVYNNGCLDFIKLEMYAAGMVPKDIELQNPNFALLAQAVGMFGLRVEQGDDVELAVKRFLACDGPALLDVVVDSNALALPPHISMDQCKGFTFALAKQALSGDVREVWKIFNDNKKFI